MLDMIQKQEAKFNAVCERLAKETSAAKKEASSLRKELKSMAEQRTLEAARRPPPLEVRGRSRSPASSAGDEVEILA